MIRLGTMINFQRDKTCEDVKKLFENARDFGLSTCQLCCWDHTKFTDENAEAIKGFVKETGWRFRRFGADTKARWRGILSTDITRSGLCP